MGAEFWDHVASYEPGPGAALLSCQIEFHRRSGIDLARYLDSRIKDMEQAVRWCQEDDPYDLLGFYQDALSQYRQMAARGIPERPEEQIDRAASRCQTWFSVYSGAASRRFGRSSVHLPFCHLHPEATACAQTCLRNVP